VGGGGGGGGGGSGGAWCGGGGKKGNGQDGGEAVRGDYGSRRPREASDPKKLRVAASEYVDARTLSKKSTVVVVDGWRAGGDEANSLERIRPSRDIPLDSAPQRLLADETRNPDRQRVVPLGSQFGSADAGKVVGGLATGLWRRFTSAQRSHSIYNPVAVAEEEEDRTSASTDITKKSSLPFIFLFPS